jgi:hypothetical protein
MKGFCIEPRIKTTNARNFYWFCVRFWYALSYLKKSGRS